MPPGFDDVIRVDGLDARDVEGRTPVTVIDETMADEVWPDQDPIGRRVAFEFVGDGDPPDPIWREVVGVVGHVRHYELKSQSRVQLYVPFTQPPIWFDRRPPLALFVRTQQDPTTIRLDCPRGTRAARPEPAAL